MERSYIAFISYKHTERDAAIAKQVHTLIENYVIPKALRKDGKKLGIVFRDEEELPISSDLTDSICTALDASRYLIVICSREAKESPWVAREVNYFLQHHDASNAFVVLADGEPNEVFPYELTHILNEETGECQEVEPLAMDVRADSISASVKKAKTNIKKLYAGMLGCTYDSLVQREKTRKMKRIAALVILAALLASCFVGMLIIKNRELSQKNDELSAAIELALNRESELLVERADEAIESGDVAAAIKYASDALYSEDVERPYYAPAERVLFYAADVLQEKSEDTMLRKVELKHQSPVEMMTYCDDGKSVCTIDSYGMVKCFASSSGDLLWNVQLAEDGNTFSLTAVPQLWYDGQTDAVICYYDGFVYGLAAPTGEILWQSEVENHIENGLFFDEAGQKLAFVERVYIPDLEEYAQGCYEYNFVALSTRDGSMLNRVPFECLAESSMEMELACFGKLGDFHSTGMLAGSDGFVGTVFRTEDGITEALLYIVDLTENTVQFVKNEFVEDKSDYMGTFCIGNNRAVVMSKKSYSDIETLTFDEDLCLQCFDLEMGNILWESTVDLESVVTSYTNWCVVPRDKSTVLAVGDHMYVVANETGEFMAKTQLYAEIVEMHPTVDDMFGFTLANGYYAVGWSNQKGLHDSNFFSAIVDLPDTSDTIHYNGGLLHPYMTGDTILGFDILPVQNGGGSMTYLSQDRYTVYVASVLPAMALPEPILVEAVNQIDTNVGDFLDMNPQGKVLMGTVYLEDGYGLTVVDTENYTLEVFKMDDSLRMYTTPGNIYLTRDGQNLIMCSKYGDIKKVALDGSISPLAEQEQIVLQTVGDMDYLGDTCKSDAARLASDGRIVAARVDGPEHTLDFWMDGEEKTTVSLPKDIIWGVSKGIQVCSTLHVGENGLMVLSDFDPDDLEKIKHFMVYDLSSQKWKPIPDAAHGSYDRLITFSQNSPLFAVYDADMNIRIYDYNTAEVTQTVRVDLPAVSVMKIGMILDDQYMYVLTRDRQFLVYCIETNEMVFRTIFSNGYSAENFSDWLDRENERLYLRADTKALCVDISTWEQLFSAENFKFYNAAKNEVYVYTSTLMESRRTLKAIPIPQTSELIDMALNVLE